MLSKNKIKFIRSLHRKKKRVEEGLFLAEGVKIAKELLESSHFQIRELIATEKFLEEEKALVEATTQNYTAVSLEELKKISTLRTPNKVLLVVEMPTTSIDWAIARQDLCLYLADLQDPGNLGTILRIADWFGIQHVFASNNSVELFNPKVIQASMGAFIRVKYHTMAFQELKNQLGLPVYGTVLDGNNVYEEVLKKEALIVIGNEGNGIPMEVQQALDYRVKIPAHKNSGTESLNVGIATGIICALFRKP